MALSQDFPAHSLKIPIHLTKVEGRMDHLAVDVKGQRVYATAFPTNGSVKWTPGRKLYVSSDGGLGERIREIEQ
jgi:hypothetical protein